MRNASALRQLSPDIVEFLKYMKAVNLTLIYALVLLKM